MEAKSCYVWVLGLRSRCEYVVLIDVEVVYGLMDDREHKKRLAVPRYLPVRDDDYQTFCSL